MECIITGEKGKGKNKFGIQKRVITGARGKLNTRVGWSHSSILKLINT